jgi:FKBP-type peptidyl-prolyl cis-trans isomerase 2
MKTIKKGAAVELHYKGTFSNGEIFDDSRSRGSTMSVLVGSGQVIKGFDTALVGMTEGQVKTVNLSSTDAYGPRYPEAVVTTSKKSFPDGFPFEEGMPVAGQDPNGNPVRARIVSFTDTEVILDHNHPLAGKDLNFEIEVVKIGGSKNTGTFGNHTVKELRAFAKEKGIKGFSTMKKAELIETLSS